MLMLSGVDELTMRVDDSVVTMINILASPHVGPIRTEAEDLGEKLNVLQVKQENQRDNEAIKGKLLPGLDVLEKARRNKNSRANTINSVWLYRKDNL